MTRSTFAPSPTPATPSRLPVAAVTSFELQRDRTKPTGAELGGGIAGMFIGAAVTTIVMENNGYAVCGDCDVPDLGYYAAVGGAIVGGLAGYAIGHSMSGGDYRPVSLGFAPHDQPRSERRVAVTIRRRGCRARVRPDSASGSASRRSQ